jgi:dihydroorotate dehydrogenase (NAD+) catalytic subunit
VTNLLDAVLGPDVEVYTCGPDRMMAAVARICAERDVPCEASLETPMACGYGVCLGCPVPTTDGQYFYACTHGPCIDARRLDWVMATTRRGERSPRRGSGMTSSEPRQPSSNPASLQVRVGSLELKNPVLTASGCFGYGLEYDDFYDVAELGGICTKGLSLHPAPGNPPERICETPPACSTRSASPTSAWRRSVATSCRFCASAASDVVANIFASSVEDFVAIAKRLERETGVLPIELNVSCPNVTEGGIEFGKDARMCAAGDAGRKSGHGRCPIWVKMSPEAGDIAAVARACEDAGADAHHRGQHHSRHVDRLRDQKLRLHNRTGGLSGPALRPIALRIVYELAGAVSIPIIGIGGIFTAKDALEFLLAGATAIQVGTANFSDPCAALNVREGIRDYCTEAGISVAELIGRARR